MITMLMMNDETIAWCPNLWPKLKDDIFEPLLLNETSKEVENQNNNRTVIIWDLIFAFLLIFSGVVANSGLLYLAKITRRSTTKCSQLDLSHGVYVTNSSRPQRLSESGSTSGRYSAQQQERYRRKSSAEHSLMKLRMPQHDEDIKSKQSKRKWRNFLKLVKYQNKSQQRNCNRKSGRYLKGLIVIAISNLVIAMCLTIWSIREIIIRFHLTFLLRFAEKSGYLISFKILPLLDLIMADIAHSIEIGSVLWIALDRTMAIQWPMQRKVSTNSTSIYTPHSLSPNGFEISAKKKFLPMRNVFTSLWRRESQTNETEKCISLGFLIRSHAKRITSFIRIFLCSIPVLLMSFTLIFFTPQWYKKLRRANDELHQNYENNSVFIHFLKTNDQFSFIYYNPGVIIMLIFGHFLIPFTILLVTSLIIYHKVSRRDLSFSSRQTSCTSKFSELSSPNIENRDRLRREFFTVLQKSVEVDSESDAQFDVDEKKKISFDEDAMTTQENPIVKPNVQQSWRTRLAYKMMVKGSSIENRSIYSSYTDGGGSYATPRLFTDEFGGSTLSLNPLNDTNIFKQMLNKKSVSHSENDAKSYSSYHPTPQDRRKYSFDPSRNSYHQRNSSLINQDTNFDTIFNQLIRNQHRRTWKILIVLLLGFLISSGPRALVLYMGWYNTNNFCSMTKNIPETWLRCVNLWAHLSMILDPIVYGFWGNRTFRVKLKFLFFHQMFRKVPKAI